LGTVFFRQATQFQIEGCCISDWSPQRLGQRRARLPLARLGVHSPPPLGRGFGLSGKPVAVWNTSQHRIVPRNGTRLLSQQQNAA